MKTQLLTICKLDAQGDRILFCNWQWYQWPNMQGLDIKGWLLMLNRHTSGVALLVAVVLGLNFSSGVQADIIVTNDPTGFGRPGFGGTDVVDWGLLGPTRTVLSNPFNHTSNGGVNITVSQVGLEGFQRRDEGGNGWTGNFTDGFQLLWTAGRNGPVTIDFATAIQGVGYNVLVNITLTIYRME